MEKPIVNPTIPYSGAISGGLQQGKMVRIQGAVPQHADRFNINFQTGPNHKPRDDTALHISVRLKQGYIARNSYQGGSWGDEQGQGRLPIGPGQQFEIIVLADQQHFKIAINGQHYCEFPYRIPRDRISHLLIDGDVVITLISWEGVLPQATAPPEGDVTRDDASKVQSPGTPQGPPGSFGPPPQGGYGPPPQGGYGPPPQGGYGPPPQGGYGPPPQGGYGPPPQGGYGPPPPGYGPPPPPGNEPQTGLDHFIQSAQSVLAEAISSGAAEKLLSGILNPNQNHQGYAPQNAQYGQYPHPPQQQQGGFGQGFGHGPQYGGEGSVGGLGGIGSFLGSLASQVFSPQQPQQSQGGQGQYGHHKQFPF